MVGQRPARDSDETTDQRGKVHERSEEAGTRRRFCLSPIHREQVQCEQREQEVERVRSIAMTAQRMRNAKRGLESVAEAERNPLRIMFLDGGQDAAQDAPRRPRANG